MKINIGIGILASALILSGGSASADSSASFLYAISGQAEPTAKNIKDENPGKNLADQNYIRIILGKTDRVTPATHADKLSVNDPLKLYTKHFEN